jgi:hypothetical protein
VIGGKDFPGREGVPVSSARSIQDVLGLVGSRCSVSVASLVASWALGGALAEAAGFPPATRSFTIAGTGQDGLVGLNGPATLAGLGIDGPSGVLAQRDGGMLIASPDAGVVLRVSPQGVLSRVAGTQADRDAGDGGPAVRAAVADPRALSEMADGGFLIAEADRVRRVLPDGTITTVAGPGMKSVRGDGGTATKASFNFLSAVAALPDGGFVVLDAGAQRVRRVLPDGTIVTMAGTGQAGFSGDGGPATAARVSFDRASGLDTLPDGSVVFADPGNGRVRRIAPDGTITTVAGTAKHTRWREGAPATSISLYAPQTVAADPDGGFAVLEPYSSVVLDYVAPDGTIHRVGGDLQPWTSGPLVGRGTGPIDGDGLLARFAAMGTTGDGSVDGAALDFTAPGDLVMADPQVRRVRLFARPTTTYPAAAVTRTVSRPGAVRVQVQATVGGTAQVRMLDGHKLLASRRRPLRPGATDVTLHGSFGNGVRTIDVIARFPGVAPIALEAAVVVGPLTVPIVRRALRSANHAELMSNPTHECRRYGPRRVDCAQGGPAFLGFGEGCERILAVGLDALGRGAARAYDCPRGPTAPFRRHPRFTSELWPALFFDTATPPPRP